MRGEHPKVVAVIVIEWVAEVAKQLELKVDLVSAVCANHNPRREPGLDPSVVNEPERLECRLDQPAVWPAQDEVEVRAGSGLVADERVDFPPAGDPHHDAPCSGRARILTTDLTSMYGEVSIASRIPRRRCPVRL